MIKLVFWIDELLIFIFFSAWIVLALWSAGHAILNKRDPRSALLWLIISIAIPILGPLSYWILGINRITRRARGWKKIGKRLSGSEFINYSSDKSVPIPVQYERIKELALLEDRVVRNRLKYGNLLEPLENGEAAYPAMIEAINASKETVNMSSYIFDGDGVGAEIISALSGASSRGVEVRVLVDAMGEKYSHLTARSAFEGSSVDIRLYLPLSKGPFINLRNHRKLLVIDGNLAFTGGMNIRTRHCIQRTPPEEATRDLHFRVQGPVVGDLQRIFLEDWHFVSGELLDAPIFFPDLVKSGNSLARAIGDGPDREFRKLEWILMGALSSARKKVRIMTPYFIADRPMITALSTASLRGVEVTLLLPAHNNLPFVAWASRASYWELVKNGVRIVEQAAPFTHTKLMVVDDIYSLIGSANLDTRSLRLNFELNLSIYDSAFASVIDSYFEQALANSKETTLSMLQERPLYIKFRDNTARLFSPYL